MTDTHDYSKFASAAPTTESLSEIATAALDLYKAELEVSRLEVELKAAQKKVEDISTHVIPDLMDLAGLEEMALKNGTKLKVEPILTIASGAGKNPEVLKWIEETGHGGLIKRSIAVSLGKDADEKEKKLLTELKSEGFTDVQSVAEVHAQTLKAHVKKLMEDGAAVDMDLLGAREFKRAKITGKPKDGSSAFEEGE